MKVTDESDARPERSWTVCGQEIFASASGAWIVAHHAEQKRRFKAVLHTKQRTYSCIKEERKKSETDKTQLVGHKIELQDEVDDDVKILDKLFLMKLCCVEDPADLCSVNISGKNLTDVKENDLLLFDNVAYLNAGENCLPFEPLSHFSSLRELEVPLNGLRNLKVSHTDFINLEVLDISYNNLSQNDLLTLGLLSHLRVLHLTGNNFVNLPEDLAMPYLSREKQVRLQRFACLEVLMLDDNKLMDPAVFAALAGLPKLRHLDLSKNEIFFVPQLKVIEGRVVTQDGTERRKTKRPGSSHKGNRSSRSHSLREQQNASLINEELKREKSESSTVAAISEGGVEGLELKREKSESSTVTAISEGGVEGLELKREKSESSTVTAINEGGVEGLELKREKSESSTVMAISEGGVEGLELKREKSESSTVTAISEGGVEGLELKREKSESSTVTAISEGGVEGVENKQEEICLEDKSHLNDQGFQELMTEDFNTGDLSAHIKDFVLENEKLQLPLQTKIDPKLPPFPELRYLNLAANKVYEEDGLMALAAWPMLEQVDVFNNPLITENSGDPPLLKRFLQQRLGIKLNRMKPQEAASCFKKSKVEIRPKYMKITENVPKIPKTSLEEKMMLPLPPPPEYKPIEFRPSYFLREAHKESPASCKKSVLPPIPTSIKEEAAEAWTEIGTFNENDEMSNEYEQERKDIYDEDNSDPVFMTQPAETDDKHSGTIEDKIPFMDTEQSTMPTSEDNNKIIEETDQCYEGYELLLNIEELENEPQLPPAKDIQSNIRALKHTLNHLLVYRDPTVELSKVQKMVQEYRRVPVPPAKPHQTYQEKIDEVLNKVKKRSTLEEENLATVLKDKKKFHKQFPEAEKLLGRIQKRYNTIQYHLILEAQQARDIAASVIELLPPANTK